MAVGLFINDTHSILWGWCFFKEPWSWPFTKCV